MKQCVICAKTFRCSTFHPNQRTCSRKCSKKAEYLKHKSSYYKRVKIFIKCNPIKVQRYQKVCHNKKPKLYRAIWAAKQSRRRAVFNNIHIKDLTANEFLIICESQQNKCWWCAKPTKLEIDHVIPITKSGNHTKANIVGSCKSCNSKKKDNLWPIYAGALYAASGLPGVWNIIQSQIQSQGGA